MIKNVSKLLQNKCPKSQTKLKNISRDEWNNINQE